MSEFRPGRFQLLPLVIKNLLIINCLVYLAQITVRNMYGIELEDMFALHYWGSDMFRPYQFVTHMFMHSTEGIFHLFSNMFALWMFGSTLENIWGPKRFLIFYMVCGIGAAFCHMGALTYDNIQLASDIARYNASPSFDSFLQLYNKHGLGAVGFEGYKDAWSRMPSDSPEMIEMMRLSLSNFLEMYKDTGTVGASGAVFGVLFAFGYLFPNSQLFIIPIPFPIKAKYFVGFYILMELFLGFRSSAGDNVAHFAHLGGVLFAYILLKIWRRSRNRFY